jgi:hypothetical protein
MKYMCKKRYIKNVVYKYIDFLLKSFGDKGREWVRIVTLCVHFMVAYVSKSCMVSRTLPTVYCMSASEYKNLADYLISPTPASHCDQYIMS